jgi:hypothetical protein
MNKNITLNLNQDDFQIDVKDFNQQVESKIISENSNVKNYQLNRDLIYVS